jgi:hypothetical protein
MMLPLLNLLHDPGTTTTSTNTTTNNNFDIIF